ncbi:MAG: DUF4955 domain-containing protein [Moritella sp.]|uniref:DUF4955 domain-containing protein n=1 Tax=Moritella sp. TaxID=78556 RepID=UPI0029B17355|nr:DUF4955 domain-containing protein [Moritella sp.]MDX2321972.1 DUF4955 domain-containing protein [Moritella sp.]
MKYKCISLLLGLSPLVMHAQLAAEQVNVSRYWQQFSESRSADSDLYDPASKHKGDAVLNNFSYVGYQRGEQPLPSGNIAPNGATYKVFNVTDFGAIANDDKSDKAAIIAAIKQAELYVAGAKSSSAADARAAIIAFPAGRLLINEESDVAAQQLINITTSNIVLRGAGQGKTELFMRKPLLPKDPHKMWSTPRLINFVSANKGLPEQPVIASVSSAHVAGSSKSIELNKQYVVGVNFKVGDWVKLAATVKRVDYIQAQVAPYKLENRWTKLRNGLNLQELHQIKAINGQQVEFYSPIQVEVDPQDDWQLSKINMLENVGLEHMTIRGNWQHEFKHHKLTDDGLIHDSAWSLVQYHRVANSWAQDLELVDFNAGLSLTIASNSTLKNIQLNGNAGHLSVQMQFSFNNLSMNVTDNSNAWHAPGFSHMSSSNVHFKTKFNANTSSDLHGAQPRLNLFDNVTGGWIYGRWGAAIMNQPNHLKGLVYWNYNNIGQPVSDFELMRKDNSFGRIIMPYLIGFHGAPITVSDTQGYMQYVNDKGYAKYPEPVLAVPQAYVESLGESVYPQSLYQAQVERRLGYLPEWLK